MQPVRHLTFATLLLLCGTASADGEIRLDVAVGKTVEVGVGAARGWFCDDTSILKGDMITRADTNYFVVTGVSPGKTSCRVGGVSSASPVSYLFEVHVTEKTTKPKR